MKFMWQLKNNSSLIFAWVANKESDSQSNFSWYAKGGLPLLHKGPENISHEDIYREYSSMTDQAIPQ